MMEVTRTRAWGAHEGSVATMDERHAAAMPATDVFIEATTEAERSILRLMAQGYSNQQIGKQLFLSEKTVKNKVSIILHKYGVRNRTEAVIRAMVCGDIVGPIVRGA
jgi:DNA-binding NarL/FixJ family response regulator